MSIIGVIAVSLDEEASSDESVELKQEVVNKLEEFSSKVVVPNDTDVIEIETEDILGKVIYVTMRLGL